MNRNAARNFASRVNANSFPNASPTPVGVSDVGIGTPIPVGGPGSVGNAVPGLGEGTGVPTPGAGCGQGIGTVIGSGIVIPGTIYPVVLFPGVGPAVLPGGNVVGGVLPVEGSAGRVAGVVATLVPKIASQILAPLPFAAAQISNAPPMNANTGFMLRSLNAMGMRQVGTYPHNATPTSDG
jgi:hypothetical protein